MLARLVPSLTGRPFTSLAASRSPTASGRATMCSTTRTRAKNTTPSFGRWLTNGFASSLSAGKSAPPITRTNTWKPLRNEAPFSLPYTCKQIHEKYGREGSGDYPEATLRLPLGSQPCGFPAVLQPHATIGEFHADSARTAGIHPAHPRQSAGHRTHHQPRLDSAARPAFQSVTTHQRQQDFPRPGTTCHTPGRRPALRRRPARFPRSEE